MGVGDRWGIKVQGETQVGPGLGGALRGGLHYYFDNHGSLINGHLTLA